MRKICYLLIFLISSFVFIPLGVFDREVIVCKNGKSSGEFIKTTTFNVSSYVLADGVSFEITKSEMNDIITSLDAKFVFSFFDEDTQNYYYYSNKISKKEKVFSKAVNVHIAITNDNITFGSPIIYYGY